VGEEPAVDDEERYATLLEEVFIAERGTPFLLSAKDWTLIRSWKERGIPADTAARAIKETFEKRRARGGAGKISSVAYCENAVEERWELERRGLVGSGDGRRDTPMAPAGDALARLVKALAEWEAPEAGAFDAVAVRSAVEKAGQKIAALAPAGPRDELEDELLAIETALTRAVKKSLTDDGAARLEESVSADLGEMPGVSQQIVERTRRALERRELRRVAGLPTLSLF
jgi:hypothetical protein